MNTPRKSALVTGSATGVGRAVAVALAKRGLAVAVNYSRSQKEAEETAAEVRRAGVPAILCQADVADDAAVRAMVARCREEFGGLDVLVNNAGATHFIDHAELDALTDDVWDGIFAVNLKGTFYACGGSGDKGGGSLEWPFAWRLVLVVASPTPPRMIRDAPAG